MYNEHRVWWFIRRWQSVAARATYDGEVAAILPGSLSLEQVQEIVEPGNEDFQVLSYDWVEGGISFSPAIDQPPERDANSWLSIKPPKENTK